MLGVVYDFCNFTFMKTFEWFLEICINNQYYYCYYSLCIIINFMEQLTICLFTRKVYYKKM